MLRILQIITLLFLPTLAPAANQADLPEDLYVKDKVEEFFRDVKTMSADFMQIDSQRRVVGGKFLLKRPDKFRWEYDKRQPLLIISNGDNLVYVDKELDEVTYVSPENTLAAFLARDLVRLEGDITLHDAFVDADFMKVRISLTDKPDEGQLALYLSKDGKKLLRMDVIDAAGYKTRIDFSNQEYDKPITNSNFIYKDPKFKQDVWDK